MSAPTAAEVTVEVDAPAEALYDLVSDVTRMGEWSPECTSCEWKSGDAGQVGSTFVGRNRSGIFRWSTTACVRVADRPREFTFATMFRDRPSTQWTYRFEGDGPTRVTESFRAISTPKLIALAEKLFLRNRQAQLEKGMAETLAAIKKSAESAPA